MFLTVKVLKDMGAPRQMTELYGEYLKSRGCDGLGITPKTINSLIKEYWFDIDWLIESGIIPDEETVKEVLRKSPKHAYLCGKYIEKAPNSKTRGAASKLYVYAYYYAKDVDKCPTSQTALGVSSNDQYSELYNNLFFNEERKAS